MTRLPEVVVRYLRRLELALKKRVGVSPESALEDARDHLLRDYHALLDSEPGLADEEVFDHFVQQFGEPESVAGQYEDEAEGIMLPLPGYAPLWRICCTRCGRSAPAARAGITRVAARSKHKYTVGWCRDCRGFRIFRLQRDMELTNLTDALGLQDSAASYRSRTHRPEVVKFIFAVLGSLLLLTLFFTSVRLISAYAQVANRSPHADVFETLPAGWSVVRQQTLSSGQLQQFSERLGGEIVHGTNNYISDGTTELQVNILDAADNPSADQLEQALRAGKQNLRDVCRNKNQICEFVARSREQAILASRARYALPVLPAIARYSVQFTAAPIESGDDMQRNELFNLCLQNDKTPLPRRELQIAKLATAFQFSKSIALRRANPNDDSDSWTVEPNPRNQSSLGSLTGYQFESLPTELGLPKVVVKGSVLCRTVGSTQHHAEDGECLSATSHWPVDDSEIRRLASSITAKASSSKDKVDAVLQWFLKEGNMRYAGQTGSRYGVRQVLQQRHGRCWDYADLFVTLCRASKVPARQVVGWLYGREGHVWAEVSIAGKWYAVDPTTGTKCGSDYIPISHTNDGHVSFVYTSLPSIRMIESN